MQDLAKNAQPTANTVSAKVHAGADATEEELDKAAKQTADTIDDGGAAAAHSTRSGGKQLGDMVGASPTAMRVALDCAHSSRQ